MKPLFSVFVSIVIFSNLAFCQDETASDDTTGNPAPAVSPAINPADQALSDLQEGDQQVIQQQQQDELQKKKDADDALANKPQIPPINILDLIQKGGNLMWAIGLLSVVGLMFAFERFIALRRGAILPPKLFTLINAHIQTGNFSPQNVWTICQQYPSPSARVIQSMLLKVGRPLPEIEAAAAATKQEEATNMYNNVRWISLVASVAPLLGLLGTVWGMIQSFYITANMVGGNRGEMLANGIYIALVTTAAGLFVAIPAAFIAHWYEGKILNAFRNLDLRLVPLFDELEKLEGIERLNLSNYQNQ